MDSEILQHDVTLLKDVVEPIYDFIKPYLLILGISSIVLWLGIYLTQHIEQRNLEHLRAREKAPLAAEAKKPAQRPFGVWEPSDFKAPKPEPYPEWSLQETKPLPYRPFKHGPNYYVTMGLRTGKMDDWFEFDNQYLYYHRIKAERIKDRGFRLCRTAEEAFDAATELLEELSEYLPARYPTLFKRTSQGITNLATNEEFNVVERPLKEDPMQIVARLVQDDVVIMIEKEDGQSYLLAGAVVLPGFWRLHDKFGMPLSEIHTSGNVPQYKEKLEVGMNNFFRRLKPDTMVLRNNYGFQIDDNLAWSDSLGSENDYETYFKSHAEGFASSDKKVTVDDVQLRTERQSLRRLPRSGAVVFTFRTYMFPVTEIAKESYVPGRLASAIRSWGEDSAIYKGRPKYGDIVLEFLDRKHREQTANGLDVSKEDEVRSYPW